MFRIHTVHAAAMPCHSSHTRRLWRRRHRKGNGWEESEDWSRWQPPACFALFAGCQARATAAASSLLTMIDLCLSEHATTCARFGLRLEHAISAFPQACEDNRIDYSILRTCFATVLCCIVTRSAETVKLRCTGNAQRRLGEGPYSLPNTNALANNCPCRYFIRIYGSRGQLESVRLTFLSV